MRLDLPWTDQSNDVRSYRALAFAASGYALRSTPIEASSDREAIGMARNLSPGTAVDLWDGLRFVEHFAAQSWVGA